MNEFEKEQLDILLVEDDLDDIEFTIRAFRRKNIRNRIRTVGDGEQALDYIFSRSAFADREKYPKPGLVILDLKLPKIDGVEVLRVVKNHPRLRTIPIIMLTTSRSPEDVRKCYQLGVNSYVVKPLDFEEFSDLIELIARYWLDLNLLPNVFHRQRQD